MVRATPDVPEDIIQAFSSLSICEDALLGYDKITSAMLTNAPPSGPLHRYLARAKEPGQPVKRERKKAPSVSKAPPKEETSSDANYAEFDEWIQLSDDSSDPDTTIPSSVSEDEDEDKKEGEEVEKTKTKPESESTKPEAHRVPRVFAATSLKPLSRTRTDEPLKRPSSTILPGAKASSSRR